MDCGTYDNDTTRSIGISVPSRIAVTQNNVTNPCLNDLDRFPLAVDIYFR